MRPASFVGSNRAHQVGTIGRTSKDFAEALIVFADTRDSRDRRIETRLSHLHWIDDRQRRLLLERLHPPIPKLRLVVQCVQNGRRVTLAGTTLDAYRYRSPVGECARWIVTRGACDGPVGG